MNELDNTFAEIAKIIEEGRDNAWEIFGSTLFYHSHYYGSYFAKSQY